MAKHKITDSRLRDVARAAAARALVEMGQRLGVTIPEEALQCVYLGVEEDGAPLHHKTRVRFEWRCGPGGAFQTCVVVNCVLHKSASKGLVPPLKMRKPLLLACLPYMLEATKNLAFLAKPGSVRCHRVAVPKPVYDYSAAEIVVNGVLVEVIMCARLEGDTWLCAPSTHVNKKKDKFIAATIAASTQKHLKHPIHSVSELCALGTLEAEKRKASSENREIDFDVASAGFVTDVSAFPFNQKDFFLLWSARTAEGWALRANVFPLARFKNL